MAALLAAWVEAAGAAAGASSGMVDGALKPLLTQFQSGLRTTTSGRRKRGTARKARLEGPAAMAGKTGTAQVRRITKSERLKGGGLAEETPWKERDHALFVAFAPLAAPRYATALVIEHGRSSVHSAAASKDIMTEILARDPARKAAQGRLGRAPGRSVES